MAGFWTKIASVFALTDHLTVNKEKQDKILVKKNYKYLLKTETFP